MNNNSITPAPWELSDMSLGVDDGVCFHIGRSDTGEMIAELHGERKDYKHIERNAELVRAAPELLELLEDVSGYLSGIADILADEIGVKKVKSYAVYYAEKVNQLKRKIGA